MKWVKVAAVVLVALVVIVLAIGLARAIRGRDRAEATADSLLATAGDARRERDAVRAQLATATRDHDALVARANAEAESRQRVSAKLARSVALTDSLAQELAKQDTTGNDSTGWRGLYVRSRKELKDTEQQLASAAREVADLRHADSVATKALATARDQMARDADRITTLEDNVRDLRHTGWKLFGIPLPSLSVGYNATAHLVDHKVQVEHGPGVQVGYTLRF